MESVLVVLDEFGEVLNVPGEPDALMRSAFQALPDVSFLFMGSKRSLMDGLFSDRRRPPYNFGRRMELGRLPYEPLGAFVEGRFEAAGGRITPEGLDVVLDLSQGHPHRAQQLAFHAFRLARASGEVADEETALAAKDEALDEAEPEFRAAPAFSSLSSKPGNRERARSTKSLTASVLMSPSMEDAPCASGNDRGGTVQTASPGTLRSSRLMARIRSFGQDFSRAAARCATASTTCSQLSTTRSRFFVRRWSVSVSVSERPGGSRTPKAWATACGTSAGSESGASSTSHTPST